jgi:glyoxylase-like metal-dependent hydrolase (beta-lactamase superfamily II)
MSTTVDLLHAGYIKDGGSRVASSITLIRDGDAILIADPGMVAHRSLILDPLAERGVDPEAVTHVWFSHHHPDHTMNAALFPNAEVVDYWARYRDDLWLDHEGDGCLVTPNAAMWLTPGHTDEDTTLMVTADDGLYALTHLWWRPDRSPEVDPYCTDVPRMEACRERVLAVAEIVIPGHGDMFRVR